MNLVCESPSDLASSGSLVGGETTNEALIWLGGVAGGKWDPSRPDSGLFS